MADNPEDQPEDESDFYVRERRRRREMRAIDDRNLEVNDRPCYRDAGRIFFDYDNEEEDVPQVIEQLREELRVGHEIQTEFKRLVDEMLEVRNSVHTVLSLVVPHHITSAIMEILQW